MFSVVIATHDSERTLVPTLATLVSGAAAGTVRDVIVTDAVSKDATAEVADMAGCEVIVSDAPLGQRLRAAAHKARSAWLMFLSPGVVLDATWIDETARFVRETELRGIAGATAAVFRRAPAIGAPRPLLVEALSLLGATFGRRPRPQQGLIIARQFYDRLGGHRDVGDTEADLLARIGRRHIVMLRAGASLLAG